MYAEEDKDDDAIEEAEDVEDDGDVRHEEEEGFEYEEEERAQMRGLHAESGVEESRRLQDDDAEQDDETEQDAGADNEEDEEDYDEDNKNDGDRDEGECAGSIYWKALPNHVDIVPRMDLGSPVADTEGDYASYIQRWVRRLEVRLCPGIHNQATLTTHRHRSLPLGRGLGDDPFALSVPVQSARAIQIFRPQMFIIVVKV
jgi:hypothetical protein